MKILEHFLFTITVQAMGAMNKAVSPEKMMEDMKKFQMESDKMAMKEELSM